MTIGKTLYLRTRGQWHKWLARHHDKEKDVWLIYYRKETGKPRIAYNDAVEEALCFGWIDSIIKKIDRERFVQRFSPRKPKSVLSEMNRQRLLKLLKEKRMTKAGLDAVAHVFHPAPRKRNRFVIPLDILNALKADREAWRNFREFPESYRRIRISYIERARGRPGGEFRKRLRHFIARTAKNKRIGFVKEMIG